MRLSPEEFAARKRRNLWIALGLVAFIVLVFATTLLRMMHNSEAARSAAQAVPAVPAAPTAQRVVR
ncbi:MAG: hypothetical protein EON88_37750 [Brevundimonas sp.]|nr:MAG: hypothetical protein EON88_37750 [Brevundimonas sp.]